MHNKDNTFTWNKVVKQFIRSEMSKKSVDYKELSLRLAQIGIAQTPDNLRSKINKGILGAQLLLQMLLVLNVRRLDSELIQEIWEDSRDKS
ncbi:MAG TPA: hypothetical protein ENI98_07885 [Gammaproteobacteria bacterium]|nr:hypothetical protein [Gammaproteobacteria bacterium]